VTTGLSPDAFAKIDTGKIRTSADVMGAHGISNPQAKSSIIKFLVQFRRGRFHSKSSSKRAGMSNTEVMTFCEKNPKVHAVHEASIKVTKDFKSIENRFIGGLYWMFSDIDQKYCDAFFQLYGTGIGLTETNPVFVLRQKLIADMQSHKKYPPKDKIAWVIIAWNYFRKDKKITKIKYNSDKDDFPKPM